MGFVVKLVTDISNGLGLTSAPQAPAAPPPPPATPTTANSGDSMDMAAQKQAAAMAGGRTSTLLNGATGVDDKKNTSKILLGQ